jgi:hypothetical protein
MSLSSITNRDAVWEAIAEYDRLGQDAFLRHYRFRRATKYLLIHQGRAYDSKAIVGAAHGYQFPELGPLRPGYFNGGLATVVRKLQELGFDVRGIVGGVDPVESSPEKIVDALANPLHRRGGQGRGLSAEERKAVELHAMAMAKSHYRQSWPVVEDVSNRKPYDLECRSGGRFLHVEVKGTTGGASSVLVTANEVDHAREHAGRVALFVVSGIMLHREPGAAPITSGGTPHIFEPWDIDQCSLRAIAFECELPPIRQ